MSEKDGKISPFSFFLKCGSFFLEFGKPQDAQALFMHVLQKDIKNVGAIKALGECLLKQGKTKEAERCFTRYQELTGKSQFEPWNNKKSE